MPRILTLSLFGLFVLAFVSGCGSEANESDQRDAIQGAWQAVSARGSDLGELDDVDWMKFVFTDERFTMFLFEEETGTYTLDPERQPKAIDLTVGPDQNEPLVLRGIYDLQGDRLRLCLRIEKDRGRPETFAVESDSEDLLIELRRVASVAESPQGDPRRRQSRDNLKQIVLAIHMHHDAHNRFPPAVGYGPDGQTPHSWRVAVLPFLGEEGVQLYDQYRLDEPWDSPHNRQLLEKMPAAYRAPGDPAESTKASVFALVGPETVFSDKEGTRMSRITDGSSNTVLVVEARRGIPWTKPEDIPYDSQQPIPELVGPYPDGFFAVFCDGAVHGIPKDTDEATLRALITKSAGDMVSEFPDTF